MAKVRLTGQDAINYLQNNPNATYIDNTTGVQTKGKTSGLTSLVQSITKPFRTGAGVAQEFGYTIGDLINLLQNKPQVERPSQYALMSEEESKALQQNPLGEGLKAGAGVASYGIGTGPATGATKAARILNAAQKGAVGGAVGGFGYSEANKELQGALTGGLTGGAVGGGFQALSELLKPVAGAAKATTQGKLGKTGTTLRGKGIGLDANAIANSKSTNISSATKANKTINNYLNTMDELGLPTTTSKVASESTDTAIDTLQQNVKSLIDDADQSVVFNASNTDDLVRQINNKVGNNTAVLKSPVYQEIMTDIRNLGDNYSPSQLNAVREKIRDTFINWNARQGLKQSSQRAADTAFDVIDKFFKQNVSGAGDTLGKLSDLYTIRNFIQSKAKNAGTLKLGTASTFVGVPTLGIDEALTTGAGRALQGLGRTAQGGLKSAAVSSGLAKAAGGAGIVGGLTSMLSQGTVPTTEDIQNEINTGTVSSDELNAALDAQYLQNQQERMNLFNQLLAQGYKVSDAKSIVDVNIPKMNKTTLTDSQRKALATLNSITGFEQEYAQGGLLASEFPLGGVTSQGRQLATARKNLIENIGRLQTGAVINDEEAKAFKELVPSILDDAETAQLKIAQLKERISAYIDLTPTYSTEYDALKGVLGLQ